MVELLEKRNKKKRKHKSKADKLKNDFELQKVKSFELDDSFYYNKIIAAFYSNNEYCMIDDKYIYQAYDNKNFDSKWDLKYDYSKSDIKFDKKINYQYDFVMLPYIYTTDGKQYRIYDIIHKLKNKEEISKETLVEYDIQNELVIEDGLCKIKNKILMCSLDTFHAMYFGGFIFIIDNSNLFIYEIKNFG